MSDTSTQAGFYTMDAQAKGGLEEYHVTRCAECALPDTQLAFRQLGMTPPQDMAEAVLILKLQMILNHDPEAETLLTYSDHGVCADCGRTA